MTGLYGVSSDFQQPIGTCLAVPLWSRAQTCICAPKFSLSETCSVRHTSNSSHAFLIRCLSFLSARNRNWWPMQYPTYSAIFYLHRPTSNSRADEQPGFSMQGPALRQVTCSKRDRMASWALFAHPRQVLGYMQGLPCISDNEGKLGCCQTFLALDMDDTC